MAIAKDKRRCTVTLTASNVDRFQTLSTHLGLSSKLMSETCDQAIKNLSDVLQIGIDNGQAGMEELFGMVGKQLQLLFDEQVEKEKSKRRLTQRKEGIKSNANFSKQKRNTVPHAKKHA